MGNRLCWTGLLILLAGDTLLHVPAAAIVGAVVLALGVIALWLEKP